MLLLTGSTHVFFYLRRPMKHRAEVPSQSSRFGPGREAEKHLKEALKVQVTTRRPGAYLPELARTAWPAVGEAA